MGGVPISAELAPEPEQAEARRSPSPAAAHDLADAGESDFVKKEVKEEEDSDEELRVGAIVDAREAQEREKLFWTALAYDRDVVAWGAKRTIN